MKKNIAILGNDELEYQELCTFLKSEDFETSAVYSVDNAEELIREGNCNILLLDLDSVNATKRLFSHFKKVQPLLSILCVSERTFHPELADIMNSHICACLKKPVDVDELIFILRSLC